MTNTLWKNPVDGDWTTATDWKGGLPKASKDAVINANGTYTVSLASAAAAHSLTVDAAGATFSETAGGSLALTDGLVLDAGTIILDDANNFGGQTRIFGGTLELGNAAALGNSGLTIAGGTVIGTADATFANAISANGSFTLAAGHGDTFKLAGQTLLNMNSGGNITFGQAGDDGVFIWNPLTLGVANGGTGFTVDVNAGTLRDGNGSLGDILGVATSTTIAAGAQIDVHGNAVTIGNLNGDGIVTSATGGGVLTVDYGNFAGSLTGKVALTVGNFLTLSGTSTFTGGTTIDSGATLLVTHDGVFPGHVIDNGILDFDPSGTNPVMLGKISGSGAVHLETGTLLLDGANTYSGGTALLGGILEIGNAAGAGSGQLDITGGTLVGTATETLSNQLAITGTATLQAAHGTTLTLNRGGGWTIGSNTDLVFGSSTNDGVIVWDSSAHSSGGGSDVQIAIDDGTLRAGDSRFQNFLDTTNSVGSSIDIASGATLDVAGVSSKIYQAYGDGTIGNSGASATITLDRCDFAGDFSGPIALDVGTGLTLLFGEAANWSAFTLLSGATLDLAAASSSNIIFSPDEIAKLELNDPSGFTGSVTGFSAGDQMLIPGRLLLSVNYSGTVAGGVLTVSTTFGTAHINMVGDYLDGSFGAYGGGFTTHVIFTPNSAVAVPIDSFDFSTSATPHVAADAGVVHGIHAVNEIAFAHDVTEAMHVHGPLLDHFTHTLFAHGHAIPETFA